MPIRLIDPDARVYVALPERADPEDQTTFVVRPLTVPEVLELRDDTESSDPMFSFREAIVRGVVGWDALLDREGGEVPYESEETVLEVVDELPWSVFQALGSAVLDAAGFSKAEVGNSRSPSHTPQAAAQSAAG